jgi:hypothetical protein
MPDEALAKSGLARKASEVEALLARAGQLHSTDVPPMLQQSSTGRAYTRDCRGSLKAAISLKHCAAIGGYRIVHQEGSHLILQTEIPSRQRTSIPDHNPGRSATLAALFRSWTFKRRHNCLPSPSRKTAYHVLLF